MPARQWWAAACRRGDAAVYDNDEGELKLDELVTQRYRLDEVNQGYQDLRDGKNIRGVIVHDS